MGNAGLLTFHGNTDLTTSRHIAERLGQLELVRSVQNFTLTWGEQVSGANFDPVATFLGGTAPQAGGAASIQKNVSTNQNIVAAPLMQPSEVVQCFSRETKKLLVMVPNLGPIALYRCEHFSLEDDAIFSARYDPIPGQAPPRVKRAEWEARG